VPCQLWEFFWLTLKVNSDPGAVYGMALCLSVRVCLSVTSQSSTTRSSAIAEGPHNASCQLKSRQLPRNSAETTCTTSPEQIEVMKLEDYRWPMCNKHVHSTMTRSSCFRCPVGVINKPTTGELWISPVYRWRAMAKYSKSTMEKLLTWPWSCPLRERSLITRLRLRMADPCTKFEVSSFSSCGEITWSVKF